MNTGAEDGTGGGEADRLLVDAALSTLGIGVWRYDPPGDLFTCDPRTARLFGLTPDQRSAGVPIAQVAAAVHPDDRERYHARRRLSLRLGGNFRLAYRTVPSPASEHRVIVRGLYRHGPDGALVEACGIVIDVTDSADDPEGHVFEAAALDRVGQVSAIDRIAMHALEVHRAVKEGTTLEARLLRPAADELLAGVARVLALSAPSRGH